MPSPIETQVEGKHLQLFFESSEATRSRRPPNFLVRVFGLPVYGRSLLTARGEIEMTAIALVLVVIFFFDWMAWTLLFNAILNSSLLALTRLTALAALAGVFFASVVVIYERQFVTSDTSRGWRKQSVPIAIRLAIIVAAALITAQPVELLFFREPIRQRIHEEGIRAHVVTVLEGMRSAELGEKRAEDKMAGFEDELECKRYTELEQELVAAEAAEVEIGENLHRARGQQSTYRNRVTYLDREVDSARQRLQALTVDPDPVGAAAPGSNGPDLGAAARPTGGREHLDEARAELSRLDGQLRDARRRYANASGEVAQAELKLKAAQRKVESAGESVAEWERKCLARRDAIWSQAGADRDIHERQKMSLRNWVQTLISGVPEEVAGRSVEIDGVPLTYVLPEYDFFAQLRVLHDLRHAVPPRWPGNNPEDIKRATNQFGLTHPRPCTGDEVPRCSEEERLSWRSIHREARHLRWAYIAVYGIAIVIPSLVLALKFLLPADLVTYFSLDRQARAGNPGAQQIRAALNMEEG